MRLKLFFSILIGVSLFGCSAAGVPYTSDPWKKLDNAYILAGSGRFLPADNLSNEALETFQNSEDKAGQAEAYHYRGSLYKGKAYQKHKELLKRHNIPYDDDDPTYSASIAYYHKAIEIYYQMKDLTGVAKSKFEMGNAYGLAGNIEKQCSSFREGLQDYEAGRSLPTSQKINILNPHFNDFEEMVRVFMQDHGCESN
jgi:tetratricopeptide (TPR) repeat protein